MAMKSRATGRGAPARFEAAAARKSYHDRTRIGPAFGRMPRRVDGPADNPREGDRMLHPAPSGDTSRQARARRSRVTRALVGLLLGAPAMAGAMDLARYLPPPDAAYVAEEVRLESYGHISLAGTLTLPARGETRNGHPLQYPAVIMISGAGKQDRDGSAVDDTSGSVPVYRPLFDLADTLTRRGIAVLRLDDRGVGASTGTLDSATTLQRADDTRAALDYLRQRPEVNRRAIALLGMSEGAMIAPMVAASDSDVRAIVLMASPAAAGREVAEWELSTRLERDPRLTEAARNAALAGQMAEWDARAQTDPWYRFYATYDPRVTARGVNVAALVLQGDLDETVPPDGAAGLADALRARGGDVMLRRFPGLGHAFLSVSDMTTGSAAPPSAERVAPEVRGAIADWLAGRLGGATEAPAHALLRRHRSHPRR